MMPGCNTTEEATMNRFDTHEVFNQAAPFGDVNLFRCDPALREGLEREGGAWAADGLDSLGARLGSAPWPARARRPTDFPPGLGNSARAGPRTPDLKSPP